VFLDGRDVSARIRDEDVTQTSSIVSTIPAVRRAMVERQRELGKRGAVMNGRDIGTVVFPNADIKFLLWMRPSKKERNGAWLKSVNTIRKQLSHRPWPTSLSATGATRREWIHRCAPRTTRS
jgi:cytidylate kinase